MFASMVQLKRETMTYVMIAVCKAWGEEKGPGCFSGPVTKGSWFPNNLKVLKVPLQVSAQCSVWRKAV